MKYDTLNALYWTCESGAANFHYLYAMNSRGWLPDPEAYSKKRREAREVRGRASKTTPCEPDQPTLVSRARVCTCSHRSGLPHVHVMENGYNTSYLVEGPHTREPNKPHIGPHPSSCLCVICHVTRWRMGYGPRSP